MFQFSLFSKVSLSLFYYFVFHNRTNQIHFSSQVLNLTVTISCLVTYKWNTVKSQLLLSQWQKLHWIYCWKMENRSTLYFWSLVHLLCVSWQKCLVHYPHPFFASLFMGSKARHKNRERSVIWMAGDFSTVKRLQWRPSFHLHLSHYRITKWTGRIARRSASHQFCISKW